MWSGDLTVARIGTFGNVWQTCLIHSVSRAALEHKAPVAIAAIDIAVLVDFKPHARMAKRRSGSYIGGAVAFDAGGIGVHDFGRVDHADAITNA